MGWDARAATIRLVPKRRRGSPRGHDRSDARVEAFALLVDRALAGIPDPFRSVIGEVAIVIEDEPTDEQLEEHDVGPFSTLYGLYEGVPRTAWGADWAMVPNRITLFRIPLEDDFPNPRELEAEVRRTVIHELGHHLGIDDARLDELGAG